MLNIIIIITGSNIYPFNGPFSGTTRVSRYQKGKTNLDFTGARDSEWQWHQMSHMQACTSFQRDNHASTPPLGFLQAGCPSCRPINSATYIHTHPFNGPLSATTWVSRYQKGKTNLDFTEARDSEWQWLQLGHMQVCTLLQTDITPAPHRSVFYRPDALPAAQPNSVKALKASATYKFI